MVMLDRFQRTTVENVRTHRGRISLVLNSDHPTTIDTAFADERLGKDLAIALQGYYQRMNNKVYLGDEDEPQL